jgi:hypothetical protein
MVPNAGLAANFAARLLPSITEHDILNDGFISDRLWQLDRFPSTDVKSRIAMRQSGARQLGSENECERRLLISDLKGILDNVGVSPAFLPVLTLRSFCIISNRAFGTNWQFF